MTDEAPLNYRPRTFPPGEGPNTPPPAPRKDSGFRHHDLGADGATAIPRAGGPLPIHRPDIARDQMAQDIRFGLWVAFFVGVFVGTGVTALVLWL